MRTLRMSSAPRVRKCPPSLVPPKIEIETSGKAADVGSCAHAVLTDVVREKLNGLPNPLDETCERFGVEPDEVRFLVWSGINYWKSVRDEVAVLCVEEEIEDDFTEDLHITGHPDLVVGSFGKKILEVIDWKSGVDSDYSDQLKMYLWTMLRKYPDYEQGRITTVWLREQEAEWDTLTRDDLAVWRSEFLEDLKSPKYNAGDHCKWCPKKHECGARFALARASGATFTAAKEKMGDMTPADLASHWDQYKMLVGVLEDYKAVMKQTVEDVGTLSLGNGKELYIQEKNPQSVVLDRAVPAIKKHFGMESDTEFLEMFLESMSITKGALLKAVGNMAPKNQIGKLKDEFMETLRIAGAVKTGHTKSLTTRKEKKK